MKPWDCCEHMQEVKLLDIHENAQMEYALWKNIVELLSLAKNCEVGETNG
jgi:hypothetical protein